MPGAGLASSGAAFLPRQAGVQAARASAFRTQKSSRTTRPCARKGQCGVNEGLAKVSERSEMSHRSEEGHQGGESGLEKSLWVSKVGGGGSGIASSCKGRPRKGVRESVGGSEGSEGH